MLLYFIFKLCIFIIKKLLNFLTKDHSNSKIIYYFQVRLRSKEGRRKKEEERRKKKEERRKKKEERRKKKEERRKKKEEKNE
jgi:hypothetical protein